MFGMVDITTAGLNVLFPVRDEVGSGFVFLLNHFLVNSQMNNVCCLFVFVC